MRHRALLLALALLLTLPLAPAAAAEPSVDPAPSGAPSAEPEPQPQPEPSAAPTDEPSASAEPTTSAEPTPEPTTSPEPSAEPSAAEGPLPTATPTKATTPAKRWGGLDPRGRYIVVLKAGADVTRAADRTKARGATIAGTFRTAVHGYVARLDAAQKAKVAADPSVALIVPDEVVSIAAQSTPTGIRRIKTGSSSVALLNGQDERVDADVAIVDTGIDSAHPDLNVAGGYNCSSSNRGLWRDVNKHGTHVAGTVGALDNGGGVVGVAPGVRLWAVKILNDDGFGYLSWYVCGLDWIASRKDPVDQTRPMFEAVNMSVAKTGSDDRACGSKNSDILHAAICRVVAAGITVVAAAGNDRSSASTLVPASYDEVVTVSALADTDGLPGGKGGSLCYSWGTYDADDTLADFSNEGSDVDLIAPGKCIWSTLPGNSYGYSSGTSMAAPHVTGAVALYKATRPRATVSEVKAALQYLGTLDWKYWTDRDSYHEKLLDVSRLDALGDYSISVGAPSAPLGERGGTLTLPVTIGRNPTFFERVSLTASAESPLGVSFTGSTSLFGFDVKASTLKVVVPSGTPAGTYTIRVTGTNWDRSRQGSVNVVVENDPPTATAAIVLPAVSTTMGSTSLIAKAVWSPATDKSSAIAAYQVQARVDAGAWGTTRTISASAKREIPITVLAGHTYSTRLRAQDAVGNWSSWVESAPVKLSVTEDTSTSMTWTGTWARWSNQWLSGGSARYASAAGATAAVTVTGRSVALVAPRGPTRGWARIYVDGSHVASIDLRTSTSQIRRIVWSKGWSTSGTHTIVVQVTGTKGHPRVDVDAIVVLK